AGTWYHLAFVYNEAEASDADKMKAYINGVLQVNAAAGAALTTLNSSTANFDIGRLTGVLTNEFVGNIDEVAIWDSALSPTDVAILSATPLNDLSSLNPVAYYKLGEESKFTSQWLVPNQMSQDTAFDFGDRIQSEYITLPQLPLYNAITVSAWIKTQKNGVTFQTIISNNQNNVTPVNEKGWVLTIGAGWASGYTKAQFFFYDTGGSTLESLDQSSAQLLTDNQWHHVVALWDGTTDADTTLLVKDIFA
ncbi:unnamed protein product, partial [marine sediment metagenome]